MSYNSGFNRKPMAIDHLLNAPTSKNGLRHLEDEDCSNTSVRTARSENRTARTNSMGRIPRMYTADSLYEINNLPVTFDKKADSTMNLNRAPRMHTAASLYELAAIPDPFVQKNKSMNNMINNERAHSNKSRDYLKKVPSLKWVESDIYQYIDNNHFGGQGKNYNNQYPSSCNSAFSASDYAYLNKDMNPKQQMAPTSPHLSEARVDAWLRSQSPNPYRELPQYRNYSYTGYENAPMAALSFAGSDTNTVNLVAELADVFSNSASNNGNYVARKPIAPLTETLNKRAFGDKSLRDLHELDVSFEDKMADLARPNYGTTGLDTINKRLLTQESMMDLHALPPLDSQSVDSEFGKQVLRDFCIESLEDVRLLPSFSSISLNHEESNVKTAIAIISNDKLIYFPECRI